MKADGVPGRLILLQDVPENDESNRFFSSSPTNISFSCTEHLILHLHLQAMRQLVCNSIAIQLDPFAIGQLVHLSRFNSLLQANINARTKKELEELDRSAGSYQILLLVYLYIAADMKYSISTY